MLVLSQYVEQLYARELLSDRSGGVGYLLKDRVSDVGQFVDAVRRVAAGGTAGAARRVELRAMWCTPWRTVCGRGQLPSLCRRW